MGVQSRPLGSSLGQPLSRRRRAAARRIRADDAVRIEDVTGHPRVGGQRRQKSTWRPNARPVRRAVGGAE